MASRGVRAPASRVSLVVGLAVVAMCLVLATPARATTPQTFHVTLGTANANMSLMGMAFFPSSLTVHQGDVLVFTDELIEPHTVTFGVSGPIGNPFAFITPQNLTGPGIGTYSGNMILNSGVLVSSGPFGNSIAVTIGVGPGTYAFRCVIHPLMSGTVTVVADGQALPKTDAQYQRIAHRQMRADLAE